HVLNFAARDGATLHTINVVRSVTVLSIKLDLKKKLHETCQMSGHSISGANMLFFQWIFLCSEGFRQRLISAGIGQLSLKVTSCVTWWGRLIETGLGRSPFCKASSETSSG
ncbi:MAG: hypothetical protein ACE5JU_15715, partial [Candidatus Binatia bacterium]